MKSSNSQSQVLLKKLSQEYVDRQEQGRTLDYSRLSADRLLILEAINDWSGQALAQGGEFKFTYGGDDPCCESTSERAYLIKTLYDQPHVAYPVSGFSLGDDDGLRFSHEQSSFRVLPHTTGSFSHAIGIAESQRISDVQEAMQLWVTCATESCLEYLRDQLAQLSLFMQEDEEAAADSITRSALRSHFSIGQVRNAMWRVAREVATLSKRQFWNNEKAALQVPKKLDKVLTDAVSKVAAWEAYNRPEYQPLGAVLSLFLKRFDVSDRTPGPQVLAVLQQDADHFDGDDHEPERDPSNSTTLVFGSFYFHEEFTPLDQLLMSCFKGTQFESDEPVWSERYPSIGVIEFSMSSLYGFDGHSFGRRVLPMLGVSAPTEQDFARHAAMIGKGDDHPFNLKNSVNMAWREAIAKLDLFQDDAEALSDLICYASEPNNLLLLNGAAGRSGLVGARVDHAFLDIGYAYTTSQLSLLGLRVSLTEDLLGPTRNDLDLVAAYCSKNEPDVVSTIANGISRAVQSFDQEMHKRLLRTIGEKLIEASEGPLGISVATTVDEDVAAKTDYRTTGGFD